LTAKKKETLDILDQDDRREMVAWRETEEKGQGGHDASGYGGWEVSLEHKNPGVQKHAVLVPRGKGPLV